MAAVAAALVAAGHEAYIQANAVLLNPYLTDDIVYTAYVNALRALVVANLVSVNQMLNHINTYGNPKYLHPIGIPFRFGV